MLCEGLISVAYAIRGKPIRVRRVVVVDVAARVDIPRIVRVATISGPQTHVLSHST